MFTCYLAGPVSEICEYLDSDANFADLVGAIVKIAFEDSPEVSALQTMQFFKCMTESPDERIPETLVAFGWYSNGGDVFNVRVVNGGHVLNVYDGDGRREYAWTRPGWAPKGAK
jgi:hypothetical protein